MAKFGFMDTLPPSGELLLYSIFEQLYQVFIGLIQTQAG
jgi:hypothetical protein